MATDPAEPTVPAPTNSILVVISAPSGGGKTTVCDGVLQRNSKIVRAITCTTRAPRDGEQDGADYYFLDADTFLKRVQAGHFLEHANVHGNSYGTLRSEVLDKLSMGRDVLLNIDVQGAASIRAVAAHDPAIQESLITIFLAPPSMAILEQRLRRRAKDSEETIQMRLTAARSEITQASQFDYIVISDSIERDIARVQSIIEAEKLRQHRMRLPEYNELT